MEMFKKGDEVWWFQGKSTFGNADISKLIHPGTIELVHDIITDISEDGSLICWYATRKAEHIWGKSREEAWERLICKISGHKTSFTNPYAFYIDKDDGLSKVIIKKFVDCYRCGKKINRKPEIFETIAISKGYAKYVE